MRRLKILEAYLQVASLGSVTAAARHLGVSQPSVTRMIQELERELDQPLFERVGQRLVLTPKGIVLRDDVERALAGVANLWERARKLVAEDEPPIHISLVSSLAFGLLTDAWKSSGEAGDPPRLSVKVDTPDHVQKAVISGDVQVGATSAPLLHRDLAVEWLGTAPCVLAVPEDDPLTRSSEPVDLQALSKRNLIGMSVRRGVPARIHAALSNAGVDVRVTIRTSSTMNVLFFIRAGAGIAIVEPLTVYGNPISGIRILRLATQIPYCFGAVTTRGVPLPDRARNLVRALREAAKRRLNEFRLIPPDERQDVLASLARQEARL